MSCAETIRDARTVFSKEMRTLARDRHTVLYSVLLPLFLYPGLIWLVVQIVLYARGVEEQTVSRVLVLGSDPNGDLPRLLGDRAHIRLLWPSAQSLPDLWKQDASSGRILVEPEVAQRWISEGRGDAILAVENSVNLGNGERLSPPAGYPPTRTGTECRVYFSAARDASALAARRLETEIDDLRQSRLAEAARNASLDESFLHVLDVEEEDLSSRQELANYVASLILPLVMVMMTALGALYPALECTVGEKERGTLETTLASPARRLSLVLGKYGAVVLFSLFAFTLNFVSMWFTLFHLREQFRLGGFTLGFYSALVISFAAVLLALLLSALMMLIGFLARTFREGQSYVTPVYILAMVPALLALSPEVHLTPALAALPVVNISLLFREALRGGSSWYLVVLTLSASAFYALAALLGATRLLRREELATGGRLPLKTAVLALVGRSEKV